MEIKLNDENFKKEVLDEKSMSVMVDFWAEWCMPCKMLGPVVEEIAKDYAGKLKVCKLNIDENQKSAIDYGVISIPTLIFFKNGQVVDQEVGFVPKEAIAEKIDKLIK